MIKNIHYNKELIEQIRKSDMLKFFAKYKGLSFNKQGNCYRCKEHNSLVVKDDKLRWFWNSKSVGGFGVIDYLTMIENMTFQQAVETAQSVISYVANPTVSTELPKLKNTGSLSLPDKGSHQNLKLIGYLCNIRGIDINIVSDLIKKNKIYQDRKGNIVFLGYDEISTPKFACIRGTNPRTQFRMDCSGSDKRYSFDLEGTNNEYLYIFESPIDALSHATLENIFQNDKHAWLKDNRLSLGGTSCLALDYYLEKNKSIKKLVFCLDNDEAGKTSTDKFINIYKNRGFEVSNITKNFNDYKDFNDFLMEYRKIGKENKKTNSLER